MQPQWPNYKIQLCADLCDIYKNIYRLIEVFITNIAYFETVLYTG